MADTDVKAWLNGAQQLFDGPQDISEETPTTTGGLSDGSMAFFVGKPKTDGSGEWILKKVTPGNLNKMVFNYLTQSDIASQLASVLGALGTYDGTPLIDILDITKDGKYFANTNTANSPGDGLYFIFAYKIIEGVLVLKAYSSTSSNAGFVGVIRNANVTWKKIASG